VSYGDPDYDPFPDLGDHNTTPKKVDDEEDKNLLEKFAPILDTTRPSKKKRKTKNSSKTTENEQKYGLPSSDADIPSEKLSRKFAEEIRVLAV